MPLLALLALTTQAPFPYGSPAFTQFVDDSYRLARKDPATFYTQSDQKVRTITGRTWDEFLKPYRRALRSGDRVDAERNLGEALHRVVKKLLPRYSLEHGFEFVNMIESGQRQCLLQSVLMASLMQRAGVNAGVVVVWRRRGREPSNNAHNCVLIKLGDGRDLLVDASEPRPFANPQGLFSLTGSGEYLYVEPQYAEDRSIVCYREAATGRKIETRSFRPLDHAFLLSEFDYYRGERAPHGVFDKAPTREGLAVSEKFLLRSVEHCPSNPLAVYMLATVERKLGETAKAAQDLQRATHLYEVAGYLPEGPRRALMLQSQRR